MTDPRLVELRNLERRIAQVLDVHRGELARQLARTVLSLAVQDTIAARNGTATTSKVPQLCAECRTSLAERGRRSCRKCRRARAAAQHADAQSAVADSSTPERV